MLTKEFNVLSLFDGISCGQVALSRAGINVNKYYASEIDQRAITVTQRNWPKTIQFGSVTKIKAEHFMSPIHLLIGGSPCQGFSFAGKQLNFEDPRSKLFFEFVRLKNELNPKYFFLENVRMVKESQRVITEMLGVEPIFVNSSLVSAQNRQRLYWTNIPGFTMPEDRGIVLSDILEFETNGYVHELRGETHKYRKIEKASCLDASYYKGIDNHQARTCVAMTERRTEEARKIRKESMKKGVDFSPRRGKELVERTDNKANCLTATIGNEQIIKTCIQAGTIKSKFESRGRVYSPDGKCPALTAICGGGQEPKIITHSTQPRMGKGQGGKGYLQKEDGKSYALDTSCTTAVEYGETYRKLTVTECERLQGLPDGYTKCISKSAACHGLGNGWQVDTIIEFFKHLKPLVC